MARIREREIEADSDDDIELEKPLEEKKGGLLDDSDLVDEKEEDVDGPDNAAARREQERDAKRKASKQKAVVEDDDVEDDERLSHDSDDDEDDERPSRRKRRNRAHREAKRRDAQQMQAMAQEIENLKGHLAKVSTDQVHLAAGDHDGHIRYTQGQLEEIDAAISRAVTESNGELHAKALRLRDEALRRLDAYSYEKQRLVQQVQPRQAQPQTQQPQGQPQPQRSAPDPRALDHSEDFLEDYPEFDANGTDQFSLMVKAIDAAIDLEGKLKPNQKAYWGELRRRMAKAGLDTAGDDDMSDDDVEIERKPVRRDSALPPRAGRNNGGGRTAGSHYTPSTQEWETLEELGLGRNEKLTEEQAAYRKKLVKSWKAGFEKEAKNPRRRY
jgi:hypothetical protein